MSNKMPAPSRKRHFRSRSVSPSSRLNARYDMGHGPLLLTLRAIVRGPPGQPHTLDPGLAPRARLARAAVNEKPVLIPARLARSADVVADRRTPGRNRLVEHSANGLQQAVRLGRPERGSDPPGVNPGRKASLVGIDIPDPGHDRLV